MKYTKDHTVYYNQNGEEIPSATTLLKIINKPALVKWGNYLGFRGLRVDDVLSTSSDLGTTVHNLINLYMENKYVIYIHTSRAYNKISVYKCLNSFLKWYNVNKIKPIFMEKQLTCENFGGTVDFYGKVNGLHTIVDYKTSKKIRLTMFIQLALYCILLEYNGYPVEQVGIVLANENNHDTKFISRDQLNPYIAFARTLVTIFHQYYNLNESERWGDDIL